MSKDPNFARDPVVMDIIRRWWDGLKNDLGNRQRLWHAITIDKVFECRLFYELEKKLEEAGYEIFDQSLARVAGVVSLIRKDRDGESLGILLRAKRLNFEDALAADRINDPDRLFKKLRRWIKILKGEAPVARTAEVVYWWADRKPNREFFYDFFLDEKQEVAV